MATYTCNFCGHELLPDQKGVCRRVVGWVRNGTNSMTDASPATAYAHAVCLETRRKGIDPNAPMLF